MARSLKPLHRQVIVVTGASSGIGLTTAIAAAQQGAKVALVSRNEAALSEACVKIREAGGDAIYVVADVSNKADVQRVSTEVIAHFGGFDTWVNDAGLSVFGKLEEVAEEEHRLLFDTNFWGIVHGSLIAVRHLKGKGGAVINLGSVASDVALPLQGMYSASKHAVKGFTDALRIELASEGVPISITLIKPSGINTPFTDHVRNYSDRKVRLPDPVYAPSA